MVTDYKTLLKQAKEASKKSYSPYSKFPVGVCVLFKSGKTYLGCNVENCSFGLTLCAERNALSSAVVAGEKTKLVAIAIYSPKCHSCFPCGACRQWISEFKLDKNFKVILENEKKEPVLYTIEELLPHNFCQLK